MPRAGRCLVVIPTFNEAENVVPLGRAVLAADPTVDVLVIDDASPDGTAERVAEAAATEPRLALLRRAGKLGLGSAYLAGFRRALAEGYARVVTMDGDWSHSPRHLPALLAGMAEHDVMIGSRYVPGGGVVDWPWTRRALSGFANLYTRTLLGLPVRDCTSGYRCYARGVLEEVDPFAVRASGYAFLEEMVHRVHRAGFRVGEVPILFEERRAGASKISRAEIYRAAWHVLRSAVRPPPVSRRRDAATPRLP
jgi:dolichol-phosphate mannosyltransferase